MLIVSLVASSVDVGLYNSNNNVNLRRRDFLPLILRVLTGTYRFSFSVSLSFSLALHLNHSRGKIAAVDEEASGREWRDFAHCATIIPVTRDTPGRLPDEILEEALSVGEAAGPILFARDPWGGPSICCARKDAAR